MKKIFLVLVLQLIANLIIAQSNTRWYFGNKAGLDFSTGLPVSFSGSAMNTGEGCAVMTDYSGAALFYTDGNTIWDATNTPMLNGTGLKGSGSATQSAIIVPWPDGTCKKYFVFTIPAVEINDSEGLNYSVVDMALNGGLGAVTATKNVHLQDSVCEKLTAIAKPGGGGFWVIAHGYGVTEGRNFYVYDISPAGLSLVPVTNPPVGTVVYQRAQQVGQMKVSPDGTKIGVAVYGSRSPAVIIIPGFVEIFNFNSATGQVTGTGGNAVLSMQGLSDPGGGGPYGLEFSANSQYAYYATTQSGTYNNVLYQVDLSFTGSYTATGAYTNWTCPPLKWLYTSPPPSGSQNYYLAALQLSPVGTANKKIYISNRSMPYVSEIDNADLSSAAYADNAVSIAPNTCNLGLPTVIQGDFTCSGPAPAKCTVTGGGHYCTGQPCPHVGLTCSDTGVGYQLYRGVTVAASVVPGSGSSLDFGPQCTPGVYTIVATNTTTGSKDTMTGSATVTFNTMPLLISPLVMPVICNGDSVHYTPASSIPGTTFTWVRQANTGVLPSSASGTGDINDFFTLSTTSPTGVTYELILSDSGCVDTQAVIVLDSPCSKEDPCRLINATVIKDSNACCYNIYISNKYDANFFSGLVIETGHLNIDNVTQGGIWGGINYQSGHVVSFGDTTNTSYIPLDSPGTNGFFMARICVSGIGPDSLKFKWLIPGQPNDSICEKDIKIYGCGVPVDTNCAGIINQKAVCNNGVVTMQFQVINKSGFTMRALHFYNTNPDVKTVSSFFPIADLAPGATSPVYSVPLIIKNNATAGCFYFSACDLHVLPGTGGQYPKNCCLDSIQYCITIPSCNGCDAISITSAKTDPKNCCYKLTLTNNYYSGAIKCLRFNGEAGTQFAILSGWNIQDPVSASQVTMCAPGGSLDTGVSTDFASFCITGTSTPPYIISIDFLGDSGQVICTKELQFDSCTLVKPTCATIVDDSMYCDGSRTQFFFYVKNYSPFALYQFDLRLSDTSFKLNEYFIVPDPPIPVGATGGPYIITVDSPVMAMGNFCIYLTGHNNVFIGDSVSATQCCTDSMDAACVPMMSCGIGANCCQFSGLTIPNGITPNNDGYDDEFVIGNSAICTNIDMEVFNRWGGKVYNQSHYNNTWGGTNMQGELLPKGTYFVVLKLATGDKKAFFVDIR